MKKFLIAFCIGFSCSLFAAPYVTNVVAKHRYPWGIVDISCEVCGIEHSIEKYEFSIKSVFADSRVIKATSHVQFRGVENNKDTEGLVAQTNGIYRFVWDANKDLGAGYYGNVIVRVSIYKYHEKVQLWESGPYWATTNIGAEKPEDYGYYFWWGDTVGYKRENGKWVASDGSNLDFSFARGNTPTYDKDISTLKNEGWITGEGVLAPEHDAAKKHWGGNWRMPTKQEFDDLNNKCDWSWTTMNGVAGCVVRGRGDYAANSIFIPCVGYGYGTSLDYAGSRGYYWSSSPNSGFIDGLAWNLTFLSDRHGTSYDDRFNGHSVRPLQGFAK
jgi:hypothetical protein